MTRKVIYNIIIVFILLSMAGCGLSDVLPDNMDATIEESPTIEKDHVRDSVTPMEPREGGELRIPLIEPDSMNPLATRSKDVLSFLGLIYEGLFAYGEDLKPEPILIESYEVSDEGKRWEFQLKKGISWHNGRELTSQDVKYTFDLLFDQAQDPEGESSIYAQKLFGSFDVARMELLLNNPHGFAITLNSPAGISFLEALTFPILPKGGEQNGEDGNSIDDIDLPIGTGPYRVENMAQNAGESIKLVRNEKWWGPEKPYIDSIAVSLCRDNEEAFEAFKADEVDLVNTHIMLAESYYMGGDTQLYRYLTNNLEYIGINYKSPGVLVDKLVREAIAYGIDRKDIVTRVYANNAQAVDSPIPPDAWYYDPNLRVYDYQPLRAEKLLEQGGWIQVNEDGYLEKDGRELKFTVNAHMDNIMQKEALNLITEQLKELGIRVETRLLPWEEYIEAIEKGDFEALIGECYLETLPDLGAMFHSKSDHEGLKNNFSYASEKLDGLLDSIRILDEPKAYMDNYREIQEYLVEELPIISLYYKTSSLVTNERINGVQGPRELMVYRNVEKWYLAP